jgi:hypothetical protein
VDRAFRFGLKAERRPLERHYDSKEQKSQSLSQGERASTTFEPMHIVSCNIITYGEKDLEILLRDTNLGAPLTPHTLRDIQIMV